MGKKSIEELLNAQTELLKNLQETNRHWLEIVQSEAALASKFATKLTTTRSIPDAMTTCQEWSNRQIEMMAEDCKLLVADTQRFMETGARFLSAAGVVSRVSPVQTALRNCTRDEGGPFESVSYTHLRAHET